MHRARILPGRFRAEGPGIMHGAKILPALGAVWVSSFQRAEKEPVLCEKRVCACGMPMLCVSLPRYEESARGRFLHMLCNLRRQATPGWLLAAYCSKKPAERGQGTSFEAPRRKVGRGPLPFGGVIVWRKAAGVII